MLPFLHNVVCWLLSAVLLLTNGLPLAFQHAHEVRGDVAHHSHRLDPLFLHAMAGPEMCDADGILAGVTEHVHLLWFGWELTFIPPKGGKPVPPPSISGGLLAKVDTRSGVAGDDVCSPIAIVAPQVVNGVELSGRVSHMPPPRNLASLPLCDTARHLRSGVQLI